ncbi:DUF6476 family protein [Roseivivax sp. CAU 1753]
MDDLSQPDASARGDVRFLKFLVTTLTATMIAGLLVIIALFVIRFREPATLALPSELAMPTGARPISVATARDLIIVVTDQNDILVFSPAGELRQAIALTPVE